MQTLSTLLHLACGGALSVEDDGRPRRIQLMLAAMLLSVLFAGLFGLAAGSSSLHLALGNLYKVPMVILFSALCAIPAGLLAWRLCGTTLRASDLMLSYVTGVLSGTMVLAVISPLVALYYHTSAWVGPMLGIAASFIALTVATVIFIRGVARRAPVGEPRGALQVPVAVLLVFLVASLVQFLAIASPILPEVTVFDGGIDRMVR